MVGMWRGEARRYTRATMRLERLLRWCWPRPEAAQVTLRYAFLPQRFRWRGIDHGVREVEQVWEQQAPRPRRYYHVRCQDGQRVTLFQDLQIGNWYVASR
jgi:hypothetical protein